MQLDHLKYLIAVKEYGSMNQAAKHLYVSQQYISKALAVLEQDLDKKLFVRGSKGIVLTVDGEVVYQYASRYETARKDLAEKMAVRYLKNIRGSVRIGAMSTASAMILPQILCSYYHDYPDISLEIRDGQAKDMLEMLQAGKIDLAIVLYVKANGIDYLEIPADYQCDFLVRCQMCYWVSMHSDLAKLSQVAIEEIVNYPVITQSKSDQKLLKMIYSSYGAEAKLAADSENPYLLHKLTAENFGVFPDIAIVGDDWMMKYAFEGKNDVKAIPLTEDDRYTADLCLLSNRYRGKAVLEQHVINFILENKWRA